MKIKEKKLKNSKSQQPSSFIPVSKGTKLTDIAPPPPDPLYEHISGATSSYPGAPYFFDPGYGAKLTAYRFHHGNIKHENSNTIYAEANWLNAARYRDYVFFRDRAAHCLDHLRDEMRGIEDAGPGGNLGAIGWFQSVMATVKAKDPEFYQVIQGVRQPGDYTTEAPSYGIGEI